MIGITDFHSHILPNVDDGSASVAESVAMLNAASAQGIGKIVATPHFYPDQDSPEKFLRRRADSEKRLREALSDCEKMPEIMVGAEVCFFSGIGDVDTLCQLTIGDRNCILVEMPQAEWTERIYHELERIYVNHNLIPIVAHVDRYVSPFRTYGIPERLSDLPVLVQANASFFLNRWTKRMALRMLEKGEIHLLGSDCHNMNSRPPRLGEAISEIRKHLGDEAIAAIQANERHAFRNMSEN